MENHWIVNVNLGCESVLTIGNDFMSGKTLTPDEEKKVQEAAESLLSFLGKSINNDCGCIGCEYHAGTISNCLAPSLTPCPKE